jgi:hypothetical protein
MVTGREFDTAVFFWADRQPGFLDYDYKTICQKQGVCVETFTGNRLVIQIWK